MRRSYYLFVCCLFICLINLNTAEKIESSNDIDRLLVLQANLKKLQDDVDSSIAALKNASGGKDLKIVEPSAIERNLTVLKNGLVDIFKIPENVKEPTKGSLKMSESDPYQNNTDQSPWGIIDDIRNKRFESAEQKLKQMTNPQPISNIIQAMYRNNSKNFDRLADFIESLTDIQVIYISVSALQREMAENGHTNPINCIRLAKVLETTFLNFPVDNYAKELGQLAYNAIKQSIEDFTLAALNAAMAEGEFDGDGNMDDLTVAVYQYDIEQWETIIYKFVNANINDISKVLDIIDSHRLMEQRVRGLSILYWSLQFNHNPTSDVTIRIASIIKELNSYKLDTTLTELLDKIIETLPACARKLFFLPTSGCIWNRGSEAYLTALNSTMKKDPKQRQVFSTNLSPGSHWYFKNIDNYFMIFNADYENEVLLASKFKHSTQLRHISNGIFKRHKKIEDRSKWLIELDNDHCYLKSAKYNEYLITSSFYFSAGMKHVFSWIPKNLLAEPQFQWEIKDCN